MTTAKRKNTSMKGISKSGTEQKNGTDYKGVGDVNKNLQVHNIMTSEGDKIWKINSSVLHHYKTISSEGCRLPNQGAGAKKSMKSSGISI